MVHGRNIGIRWTIGNVSTPGYEALRLAVHGACRVFGPDAAYVIYVNSVPIERAREQTGELPAGIEWRTAPGRIPPWIVPFVDTPTMIEGKVWKLDPLVAHPGRWAIAMDNDCILWEMPASIESWLLAGDPDRCLIAADVTPALGVFSAVAGHAPRNSGIRGTPPGFDLERRMRAVLEEHPAMLRSELDEQGLQVAAVSRSCPPVVVGVDEVAISSPFPPHSPELGRSGAHFVGLNERSLPWSYDGRPAVAVIREHWERHRPALYRSVGLAPGDHRLRAGAES